MCTEEGQGERYTEIERVRASEREKRVVQYYNDVEFLLLFEHDPITRPPMISLITCYASRDKNCV